MDLNKIQGTLAGVMLGDALGHPHEFRYNTNVIYTGKLEYKPRHISRWQGTKYAVEGQTTDDTEMTLALSWSLIKNKGYNRDDVILSYEKWAGIAGHSMGYNTRELFGGVKTVKGYENRYTKAMNGTWKNTKYKTLKEVQSNGTLMRCTPLAILDGYDDIITDINLTNPNEVNLDCGILYITAIRMLYNNWEKSSIYDFLKSHAQTDGTKKVFEQIDIGELRNVKESKGWVLHGFYCAMLVLKYLGDTFNTFSQGINHIIKLGGDTDTNGAIVGGLLGAYFGFNKMLEDCETKNNIAILLAADTKKGDFERPIEYTPSVLYDVSKQLYETFKK